MLLSSVGRVLSSTLLVIGALGVLAGSAQAHMANFTGNQTYDCSGLPVGGGCWQDGDSVGTTNNANKQAHSYGY